jgi:hypothetical protein
MASIEFRHTNKQRLLGCTSGFFVILFMIAFTYILLNIGDFWETHAVETIFLIVLASGLLFSFLKKMQGGKELKSKIALSGKSVVAKGEYGYALSDLCLDEYVSNQYHCFHLYTNDKMFTLYTNEQDDFIKELLKSDIQKNQFEIDQYEFDSNSAAVMFKAKSGRMLGFNLDSGAYSIFHVDDEDDDKPLYEPEYFIQTPGYKRK